MKRMVSLLLCGVLLCGCTVHMPPETVLPEDTQLPAGSTAPTQEGTFLENSRIESLSAGAVQAFSLPQTGYTEVRLMGENLLVFRQPDQGTELTLLSGTGLREEKRLQLSCQLLPSRDVFRVDDTGIVYADYCQKAIIWLDATLRETKRLLIPGNATGCVALSEDELFLYYGTQTAIRVLDISTGVSKLLKEQYADRQDIDGWVCNRYLRIVAWTEESCVTGLINAATGQTLHEGDWLQEMYSQDDWYFLPVIIEGVRELVFGTHEGKPQVVWPAGEDWGIEVLPEQHRLVTVDWAGENMGLSLYDLDSGWRSACLILPGYNSHWGMQAGQQGEIWFFLYDDAFGKELLCRWDPEKSSTQDETVFTSRRFTREDPDLEGYALLKEKLAVLEETHGIDILLGDDVKAAEPWDYIFGTEYLVPLFERYLQKLEQALLVFPEGLLRQVNGDRPIHISLVRGIYGSQQWGTLSDVDGIQYWQDTECYIALAMNDELERNLIHAMALAMENRILSTTSALYEWNKRNPEGFAYDNDYVKNQLRQDTAHMEGENRAFIDLFSMSYAKEDRATIMEYACMPDAAEYFVSETMQGKLRAWCTGVRKAFGLTAEQGPYLWEQYLQKPLK